MDTPELVSFFPNFIASYLEEASPLQPVSPDPIHQAHPSWSFFNGPILTVAAVFPDSAQLRVTLGLALEVPYTPEVSHSVNRINNKDLVFGRMFLIGNEESGLGGVLMQEIFLYEHLSEEHVPSLQNLLQVIATLAGQAGRLAPQIREQHGGRPFGEEDAFFLQMNG